MRGTEVDASAVAGPRAILGSELIAEEVGSEAVCEERCPGRWWLEKLQLSLMHRNRPGKASSTPSLFFASHTSPPLTQDPSGEFAKPSIPGEDSLNST